MNDESLHDSLARAGTHDSHGHFTLDVAMAQEKLAAYLLSDANTCALKLLQSAVLAGAHQLVVLRSAWQAEPKASTQQASSSGLIDGIHVVFRHDGFAPDLKQLECLFDYLLEDAPDAPFLQPLALAVNTLCRSHRVWVRAWDSDRAVELLARSGTLEVQAVTADGPYKLFRRGVEVRVMDGARSAAVLQLGWVTSVARFAPIDLEGDVRLKYGPYGVSGVEKYTVFSGNRVSLVKRNSLFSWFSPKINANHHIVEVRFYSADARSDQIRLPASLASHTYTANWDDVGEISQHAAALSTTYDECHAALALRADPTATPEIVLVRHGAVIGTLKLTFSQSGVPNLMGVVNVDHYRTDVSGLRLLDTKQERLIGTVGRNIVRALTLLAERWPGSDLKECLAHALTGKRGMTLLK